MSFSAFAKDYAIVVNGKSYDVSFLENQTALDFTGKFKDKETSLSKFGGFEYYTNSNLVIDKNAKQTSTYETGKIYFNLDYNAISFVYANHNLGSARAILIGEFKDKSILKVLEKGSNKLNVRFTDKVSAGAKKSLVVYYSCTGTTHELAQRIAAETDTLRESSFPSIGMRICASAACLHLSDRPVASVPITIAVPFVIGQS